MRKSYKDLILFTLLFSVSAFSCDKYSTDIPLEPSMETGLFKTENVSVELSFPPDFSIEDQNLHIITFLENTPLEKTTPVKVSIPLSDKCQLCFITSENSGNPIFLGVYYPSKKSIEIGIHSTALALSLLNPFLTGTNKNIHDDYISAVLVNDKFDAIVNLLKTAYKNDAETALDYDKNPELYTFVCELMIEITGGLGLSIIGDESFQIPYIIENKDTSTFSIENTTNIWYGVGIYEDGRVLKSIMMIPGRQGGLFDIDSYSIDLDDGYYRVFITKGFEYGNIDPWSDPKGRATVFNTIQAITCIIETGTGCLPTIDENLAADFPKMIKLPVEDVTRLRTTLEKEDQWGYYRTLADICRVNSGEIAHWLWKNDQGNNTVNIYEASGEYISHLTEIIRNNCNVLAGEKLHEENIPIIVDHIKAPEEISYFFTRENENIISWKRKYTVAGRVLEDRAGLSDVNVRIIGNNIDTTVVSDSEGNFEFSKLDDGTYTLTISKDYYSFSYSIFKIQIDDSDVTLPDIMASKSDRTHGNTPNQIHGIEFVTIPAGSFQMGDVENVGEPDEKPVHFVTLDSYDISAYEITFTQYISYLNNAMESGDITVRSSGVFGKTGKYSGMQYADIWEIFISGAENEESGRTGSLVVKSDMMNRPVTNITWFGAKAFAEYYGFDLPTEAEWECASRGGNQYKYGTDDGTIGLRKATYSHSVYKLHSHPTDVGCYAPNPFGLYDMCGNVLEWCNDMYDSEYYSRSPQINPGGGRGSSRVIRGGCWSSKEKYCRSAARFHQKGTVMNDRVGFRVVRRLNNENQ